MRTIINGFGQAQKSYERVLREIEENPAAAVILIHMLVPSGIYSHFKSTEAKPKRYLVVGPHQDVDSEVWSVTYMALYKPHFGVLASRPLLAEENGFIVPIDRKEYRGRRFVLEERFELPELFQQIKRFR